MNIRRPLALGIAAGALTLGAMAAAHSLARAAQRPIVVTRFLLGHMDRKGRFIATSGRFSTNIDRNALAMFAFSGAVDSGPNQRASLPLTLEEQKILEDKIKADPDYNPARDGYEPGVTPRKQSTDRAAYYVATGSVSPFSVVVAKVSGSTAEYAGGQIFKYIQPRTGKPAVARLLFNPRYTVSTFNQPGQIDYHPEALEANTRYTVFVDGGQGVGFDHVTNRDGIPLAEAFATTFTTNNRYVQDFNRPEVRTIAPGDQSTGVQYDADIDLTFDEPMDVSSFVLPRFQGDDQWTMIVRYSANPVNGVNAGRNVLGVVRIKPQTAGNVVQFRPLQGFGKGPYEIEVVVTNGVTDLSGNNIIRQFQFSFRTESNPDAEDFSDLVENFNNTNKRDATFVPSGDYRVAGWNSPAGLLTTSVQEVSFDVAGPNAPTSSATGAGVNVWYHVPIYVQALYPAALLGGRARTISGVSWVRGVWAGRTYPNFRVYLGHANDQIDAAGFTQAPSANNFGDSPVNVIPTTTYRTTNFPPTGDIIKLPPFLNVFDYDGQRAMIFDMLHNGDPVGGPPANSWERWRVDAAYPIACSTVLTQGATSALVSNWLYSTRFTYLTPGAEAQSTFYDIGRNDARTLPQQIVPTTQPQGTSVILVWQGAKEDSLSPSIPDMTTLTGWLSDIRQLANYRYIRFRATLQSNTHARTSPALDILTIPYVWK